MPIADRTCSTNPGWVFEAISISGNTNLITYILLHSIAMRFRCVDIKKMYCISANARKHIQSTSLLPTAALCPGLVCDATCSSILKFLALKEQALCWE